LAGILSVVPAVSGMRAIGWLGRGHKDTEVAGRARSCGLEVAALSDLTLLHSHPDALILGFAGCSTGELKRGAEVLAGALESPVSTLTANAQG
jgi:GntR family transcriptional regulator/MocR family aminotransferase